MAGAAKTVYIELIARTKKFNAGLKNVDKKLSKTQKAVGAVSAAILAVGVLAIRGLVKELGELSIELDAMIKTSRGLGVSFEFLEDMQFVFARLGGDGSPEAINKMLIILAKATSDAADGMQLYVDEFEKLGINVDEFVKLRPEAQLFALKIAYGKTAKETKHLAAMGNILGRGFKKNLPVFAESTDEFIRLIGVRRELGGFTRDAALLAEVYDDLGVDIDQVARGMKNEIFISFGPTMIKIGEAAKSLSIWLRETGLAVPLLVTLFTVLATAMGFAAVASVALMLALTPISLLSLAITAAVVAMGLGIGTLIVYWDDLLISIRDFGDVAGPILDKITAFGGEVLGVLGFGSAGDVSNNAPAPIKIRGHAGRTGTTSQTIINNNYAPGQTPAQQRAEAKRQEQAALAGKRR